MIIIDPMKAREKTMNPDETLTNFDIIPQVPYISIDIMYSIV